MNATREVCVAGGGVTGVCTVCSADDVSGAGGEKLLRMSWRNMHNLAK